MPSDEVDELYVTLKFREELGETIDDIDDTVDDVERSFERGMSTAQAEVEATTTEVQQLQRSMRRLDRTDASPDIDVDEDRSISSAGGRDRDRGGRLPGELDEVQEAFTFFTSLGPQVQAALGGLAAAAVASSAALGAAGGLAAAATQLAVELGPQGLQNDVRAVGASFRESGRQFATAFEDVIRGFILPAGRGFASAIRGADEALASFTGTVLANLDQLPGALGLAAGALRGAASAGRTQTSTGDALAGGVGDLSGIRDIVSTVTDQIERVRERFARGLIPEEEMLSQIVSFREDAFKQLQKLEQKFPEAFPPNLLDSFAAKLRKVKDRLKTLKGLEQFQKTVQDALSPQQEPQTGAPQGAGLAPFDIGGAGGRADAIEQQTNRLEELRQKIRQTGKTLNNRLLPSLDRMTFAFADAALSARDFGQVFERILRRVATEVVATLTKILALKAATAALGVFSGGGASAFSGIVQPGISGAEILSGGVGLGQAGAARLNGATGVIEIPVTTQADAVRAGRSQRQSQGHAGIAE